MKRIIALILTLALVLTFAACGEKEQPNSGLGKTGVLSHMVGISADQLMVQHIIDEHTGDFKGDSERILYNNISSALLALDSDEIQYFGTNTATADYIVANNDELKAFSPAGVIMQTEFSMLTMEDDAETYDLLNTAITALKENGTLDQLIEDHINDPEGHDEEVEIPTFDGADTIRIAITGDIPPLDYTTADGKPAGFNVALIAALAEQTGVNIEPVTMESGSRATALASDKVDAIFWVCATICKDHPEVRINEAIDGTKATVPYIILDAAVVSKK